MARRSRAREAVLQLLFQEDFNPDVPESVQMDFLFRKLNDTDLIAFAKSLLDGVRRNREELDRLLEQAAEHWSLPRMAATDRNVLRLGAYEILYTDTPGRVAINEAVELAKRFGTSQSAQFVNGILDRLYNQYRPDDSPPPSLENPP